MPSFCYPALAWPPLEMSPSSPDGTPHSPGAVGRTGTVRKQPTSTLWRKRDWHISFSRHWHSDCDSSKTTKWHFVDQQKKQTDRQLIFKCIFEK